MQVSSRGPLTSTPPYDAITSVDGLTALVEPPKLDPRYSVRLYFESILRAFDMGDLAQTEGFLDQAYARYYIGVQYVATSGGCV